jgi:hypothetical protein
MTRHLNDHFAIPGKWRLGSTANPQERNRGTSSSRFSRTRASTRSSISPNGSPFHVPDAGHRLPDPSALRRPFAFIGFPHCASATFALPAPVLARLLRTSHRATPPPARPAPSIRIVAVWSRGIDISVTLRTASHSREQPAGRGRALGQPGLEAGHAPMVESRGLVRAEKNVPAGSEAARVLKLVQSIWVFQ